MTISFSKSFTCFQKYVSAIELAVGVADDAFVIEFVVVDATDRESNGCPYEDYSLNCLFAMSFQLVGFLLNWGLWN